MPKLSWPALLALMLLGALLVAACRERLARGALNGRRLEAPLSNERGH